MSRWVEFLKDYAQKNNTTYMCALSDGKANVEYRKKYGLPPKGMTQKKEREMMGKQDMPAPAPIPKTIKKRRLVVRGKDEKK